MREMLFSMFGRRDTPPYDGGDASPAQGHAALSFSDLLPMASAVVATDDPAIRGFSSAAISQAVAMMAEDTRTHLQSMEQVYLAANAKALVLLSNPATAPQGEALLTQIQASQTQTITFATGTATVAAAFSKL
jgi:hypothetical protein